VTQEEIEQQHHEEQFSENDANYDRGVTLYSPDGRILQIEYARITAKRGSPVVIVSYQNKKSNDVGIICSTVQPQSPLKKSNINNKIMKLSENLWYTMAGITCDGLFLFREAQRFINDHHFSYEEKPSINSIVSHISEIMHSYTCIGGMRPLGTSGVFFGVENDNIKIIETDPSGTTQNVIATTIGSDKENRIKSLEKYYSANKVVTKDKAKTLISSLFPKNKIPKGCDIESVHISYNTKTKKITVINEIR